jgi:hypothetical protein
LVLDRCQPRALVVDPSARLVDTRNIGIPGSSSCTDQDRDLQHLDGAARMYFEAHDFRRRSDSLTLVRWDPNRQHLDTIARLRGQEETTIDRGGGLTMGKLTTFSPADGWGVAPDGRVAIVRAVPYHVEWITPDARRTSGPVIDVDAIRVTERDKAEFREQYRTRGALSIGTKSQGKQEGMAIPEIADKFAEWKPPFEPSGVLVSSDGRVWVRRMQPAGVTDVVYDVFDSAGTRVDRLQLGPRRKIVGVGRNVIYVSRLDSDELPHLEKYALDR